MVEPEDMRIALITAEQPYVLRKHPSNWNVFDLSFEEWCQKMDEHNKLSVPFDTGTTKHCDTPYWEKFRGQENLTFIEFANKMKADASADKWYSLFARSFKMWPDDLVGPNIFNTLVENSSPKNSIHFFLGSKGSHTPCHYNKVGVNIDIQIYGHTSWLLFPPSTPFTPTRIPFKRARVFSKENFYSPMSTEQFGDIGKNGEAYHVILEPGDVLVVPPKWWQYCERLDTSLNIRAWLLLAYPDSLSRFEDSFVQQFVDGYMNYSEFQHRRSFTTRAELLTHTMLKTNMIHSCTVSAPRVLEYRRTYPYGEPLFQQRGKNTRDDNPAIFQKVQPIDYAEFEKILKLNSTRHDQLQTDRKIFDEKNKDALQVVDAICHPEAIATVARIYLQQVEDIMEDIRKKARDEIVQRVNEN